MTTGNPRSPLAALSPLATLALLLAVAPSACLLAQEPPGADQPPRGEVVVDIAGDVRPRVRLALPAATRPRTSTPGAQSAFDELERTLRQDLELHGDFVVSGPEELRVLRLTGDQKRDFVLYQSLGNEHLVSVDLKLEGPERVVLEGKVYQLSDGRFILGKRYGGGLDLVRRIAHTFADEIARYLVGRRGLALTQIVFLSDRDDQLNKELFLMDYDGANQRRISGHRSISISPAWSPSGDGIAYASYFGGSSASLYWVDLATGKKSDILVDDRMTMSPTMSPDGRRLAFARSLDGNWDIYVAARERGTPQRLTSASGIDTNPAWGPTGREIAFTSDRAGTPQIYVMEAEGTDQRRVTNRAGSDYNDGAAWHPRGDKLAFSHRDSSNARFDIAEIDLVTNEIELLTGPPGSHESPS